MTRTQVVKALNIKGGLMLIPVQFIKVVTGIVRIPNLTLLRLSLEDFTANLDTVSKTVVSPK